MRYAPLLALLALGCSETPAPDGDAQVDASRPDLCVCQDGTPPPDVVDAGGADVVDAPALVDAPDAPVLPDVVDAAVSVDATDVVAVVDAVATDAVDAAGGDAGIDVATVDAPDVQLADVVDVATDRPDVVDVPQDAGPVLYDLNAVRTGLSAHFAGSQLPPDSLTCPDDPRDVSCTIVGNTVNFYARACYTDLTGRLQLGDAGASVLFVGSGCLGGCGTAPTLRFTTGQPSGLRQSLHVQFAAPPFRGAPGFGGVPGRTVDPALADLWLLGCELR